MGIFSSKIKKYYGVSHSRMIPDEEIPKVLVDSTAAYIAEAPNTGNMDLVDYNTLAIENAMSTKVKRMHNWLMYNPNTFDGISPITPTYYSASDNKVIDALKQLIEGGFPNSTVEYLYLDIQDISMVHSTYIILSEHHGFNPNTNKIVPTTSAGQTLEGYLDNVTIYLAPKLFDIPYGLEGELTTGPNLAYPFISGYTPFREEDRTVLNPENFIQRSIDNVSYFYFDVIKTTTMQVDTEYTRTDVYDELEEEVLSSNTNSSTVTTGAPENHIDRYVETLSSNTESTEYSLVSSEQNEDLTWTKIYKRTEIQTDELKVTYVFKDDYAELLDYEKAIKQYQDSIDSNPNLTQEEKDVLLIEAEEYYYSLEPTEERAPYAQIGFYVVKSDGSKELHYESLPIKDETALLTQVGILNPARFTPDIYIRADWDFLYEKKREANEEAYKDMKRIAKKLGINYDSISEQMKEETDDLDKVPTMYMTFGISIGDETEHGMSYLFDYLERYFNACDLEGIYSGPDFNPVISVDEVNTVTSNEAVLIDTDAQHYASHSEVFHSIEGVSNSRVVTHQSSLVSDTGFLILDPHSFKQQYAIIKGRYRWSNNLRIYKEQLDNKKIYVLDGLDFGYGDTFSSKRLSSSYIAKCYIYGSIGPVGTCRRELAQSKNTNTGDDRFWMLKIKPVLAVSKQITDDYYAIYQIYGINITKAVLDSSAGYADKEDILLPLDFDLYKDKFHAIKDKELFIYRSLFIEAQTYQRVKIKWYQKGWVKGVLLLVSFSAFLFGPAGVIANGLAQALINLAVMYVVVEVAVWALGKVLSPEQMQIVAGLLTIAGMAGKFGGWGGVQFSTRAFTVFLLNAKTLVAIAGKLRELSIQTVNDEFKERERMHMHRMTQLEAREANVAYRPSTGLNYQNEDLRVYPVMQDTSLDSMISRTLNPNPGLLSIEYAHSYVDYILGLPTPQETVYKRYNNFN